MPCLPAGRSLSVETVSGTKLGHVHDLVFEIDGQLVAQYEIRFSLLSGNRYLVNRDQVVRFESDRLVVEDGVLRSNAVKGEAKKAAPSPEPVAMRDQT
jgi:uncharacterized protein YrrD